jgi:hypothetical protein
VQQKVPYIGIFDYHLTKNPFVGNKYIEMYHTAQFFGVEDFSDPPFEAAPFPQEPVTHMVTLWASDFVANSFFYVFKDELRMEITPELVNISFHFVYNLAHLFSRSLESSATISTSTAMASALESFCPQCVTHLPVPTLVNKLCLQETAAKYPDGKAIIRTWATEQPVLTVTPDVIKLSGSGVIEVYVRNPSGETVFLFSAELV